MFVILFVFLYLCVCRTVFAVGHTLDCLRVIEKVWPNINSRLLVWDRELFQIFFDIFCDLVCLAVGAPVVESKLFLILVKISIVALKSSLLEQKSDL